MCVDFAIRNKETGNHHVHIMLNVRPLKEDGAWARSAVRHIDWNDKVYWSSIFVTLCSINI